MFGSGTRALRAANATHGLFRLSIGRWRRQRANLAGQGLEGTHGGYRLPVSKRGSYSRPNGRKIPDELLTLVLLVLLPFTCMAADSKAIGKNSTPEPSGRPHTRESHGHQEVIAASQGR